MVSCNRGVSKGSPSHHPQPDPGRRDRPHLVLGVRLEQENIHDGQLVRKSVSLKLLSHSGSDRRDGHGHVVHGLDFGGLVLAG